MLSEFGADPNNSTAAAALDDNPRRVVGDYEVGRLIGLGPSSRVRLAMHLKTREPVAIKIIDRASGLCVNHIDDQFKKDVARVRLFRHKYLNTLREVMQTQRHVYIVTELATGGELFDKIVFAQQQQQAGGGSGNSNPAAVAAAASVSASGTNCFAEDTARKYFQQLVCAIRFCHANGMAHLNLKPSNLLLDRFGNLQLADLVVQSLRLRYGSDPFAKRNALKQRREAASVAQFTMSSVALASAAAAAAAATDSKESKKSAAAAAKEKNPDIVSVDSNGATAAAAASTATDAAAASGKKRGGGGLAQSTLVAAEDLPYGAAVACVGNAHLAAPEIILQKGYSPWVSDIWSLGALLYLMLAGHQAFDLTQHDADIVEEEMMMAEREVEEEEAALQQMERERESIAAAAKNSAGGERSTNESAVASRTSMRARSNSRKTKSLNEHYDESGSGGGAAGLFDKGDVDDDALAAAAKQNPDAMAALIRRRKRSYELVAIFKRIERGTYRMSPKFSEGARDLIRRMLVVEPARRCSINDVVAHPWFQAGLDPAELDIGTVLTPAALEQMQAAGRGGGPLSGSPLGGAAASRLLKTFMAAAAQEKEKGLQQTAAATASSSGVGARAEDDDEGLSEAERCLLRGDDAFVLARKLMLASLVCSPRMEVVAAQAARAAGEDTATATAASFQPTAAVRYVLLRLPQREAHTAIAIALEQIVPGFQRPQSAAAASSSPGGGNNRRNAAAAAAAAKNEPLPALRGFVHAKNGLLTFRVSVTLTVVPHLSVAQFEKGRGEFFDYLQMVSAVLRQLGESRVASSDMAIRDVGPTRVQ